MRQTSGLTYDHARSLHSASLWLSFCLASALCLGACDDSPHPSERHQELDQGFDEGLNQDLDEGLADAQLSDLGPRPPWPEALELSAEELNALSGRCLSLSLCLGAWCEPVTLGAHFWRASDLGSYVALKADEGYLSLAHFDEGHELTWLTEPAPGVWGEEGRSVSAWSLTPHPEERAQLALHSVGEGRALTLGELPQELRRALSVRADELGLSEAQRGAPLVALLTEAAGCVEPPELSLDASGEVSISTQEALSIDVDEREELFGLVDAHAHLFANLGFGPSVHGEPFHPLGVERALPDCSMSHGEEGRRDVWGYFADREGSGASLQGLITALGTGQTAEPNHATSGYPTFEAWPNAPTSSTHQTMYHRWLERAWLGGLRLMVLHAVGNEVICELQRNLHPTPELYECNEMEGVRRTAEAAHALERYLDGLAGGEGEGFFRLVKSPEEAREVIKAGKLAVLLGIETSNLFDCYVTQRGERPTCDLAHLERSLEEVYELGVRVLFPVHKLDNAFSAGDGHRGVIELANLVNSGHYSNFVQDCPTDSPHRFDHGPVVFGGLNQPRQDYSAPPLLEVERYGEAPLPTLLPYLSRLQEGPLEGEWCQAHGLTPLGERLLLMMMQRGMLIELDHFPRKAYASAFALLEELSYPGALGTHGESFNGKLYELGGLSKVNLGRCREANNPSAPVRQLNQHLSELERVGGYPSVGFAFDLNGFAGYPRPRFGAQSSCTEVQGERLSYPFMSYAGDVTFTPPQLGEREVDFNEEGLVHVGLLPELIEDARLMGASREELAPLFRSAEAYLRVWERAEARSQALEAELRERLADF